MWKQTKVSMVGVVGDMKPVVQGQQVCCIGKEGTLLEVRNGTRGRVFRDMGGGGS